MLHNLSSDLFDLWSTFTPADTQSCGDHSPFSLLDYPSGRQFFVSGWMANRWRKLLSLLVQPLLALVVYWLRILWCHLRFSRLGFIWTASPGFPPAPMSWQQQKDFLSPFLPLVLIAVYLIGFYIGVIILPPCENVYYFDSLACGSYPCYQDVPWLNTWDYVCNGVLCNILEAIFSISLLLRTIWRKFYSQRRFHWKRYRKMTIQLLSISTLSLCINLPQSLIILIQNLHPDLSDFGVSVEPYLFYLTGYIILLLPFVCLGCLPELWPKMIFFSKRHRRIIGPMTITVGGGGAREHSIFVRAKDS